MKTKIFENDCCNTLPRKILVYRTHEDLFKLRMQTDNVAQYEGGGAMQWFV